MNEILIKGLSVECRVGVPDDERAHPQRLLIDATLVPRTAFADLRDELALTADYDAAARRIAAVATERPRKLIETLAADLATMLLREFPLTAAEVEIRKFILPQTEYVAVRCRLTAPTDGSPRPTP
jgi:dihydroneopterin aldolase